MSRKAKIEHKDGFNEIKNSTPKPAESPEKGETLLGKQLEFSINNDVKGVFCPRLCPHKR